jgi:hydrogenase maturation protease
MSEALVIGYGNPLCGDDALGWRAVERCRTVYPEVEALWVQQLTPELAERIARARAVVFVDARAGDSAGRVSEMELWPWCPSSLFSHDCRPSLLLTYARELYRAAPPALLLSVTGRQFLPGQELSLEVAAALPSVVKRVSKWLTQLAAGS